jgi:hypothetical protein
MESGFANSATAFHEVPSETATVLLSLLPQLYGVMGWVTHSLEPQEVVVGNGFQHEAAKEHEAHKEVEEKEVGEWGRKSSSVKGEEAKRCSEWPQNKSAHSSPGRYSNVY